MIAPDEELVIIGQFGSPHGVKGWIKLTSYTKPLDNILNYQPWHLQTKTGWRLINFADAEVHAKGIVVKVDECNERDGAKLFTNTYIAVPRRQLPDLESGEYYWNDLVGLTVVNLEKIELGKVNYLLETGSNDVMVVVGDNNKQHLIPYLPNNIVHEVNLESGTITVDWNADF